MTLFITRSDQRIAEMSTQTQIHPTALVETSSIGSGTRIWAFAHVLSGATIGADCKLGDHVFVEGGAVLGDRVTVKNNSLIWHGVQVGNDVFIGPNTIFTNDLIPRVRNQTGPEDWTQTVVADGASIGANATILCGNRIGTNSMVGAGSVVTRDVADHSLVVGNPAVHKAWVCECGVKLAPDFRCSACGRSYRTTVSGLEELR